MLVNHSPDKENRSPQGKRRDKPKDIKTAHQLLQVLAINNINISSQLSMHLLAFHPNTEIKLHPCKQDEDQLHLLKVKLADYEFELKKMGEDFAEFQLLAKMEKDKQVRRLREELETQRAKNIEDNSKWEKKFAERKEQYEKDCHIFRQKVQEEAKLTNDQNLAKLQARHEETVHSLYKAHEQAVNKLHRTVEEVRVDWEQRLKSEREAHQRQLVSLRRTHETVLKEKEEVFESKIIAVESEKKAQMRATEETKKESTKIQEKYLHQIGVVQREKRKIEENNEEIQMKCKVLSKRLEDRNREIEQLKEIHQEELARAEHDRINAEQTARAAISHEKAQFLRDQYTRTEQIQMKLIRLNDAKEQMQGTYESLLRTLETRFQKRQSKREDIEALREFEEQLICKERENTQIYHQLRMVQLEKENNDKIYTRIFTSNKKEKKSLSHKAANDLHTLFKQSQTTDFRHLLKLGQK